MEITCLLAQSATPRRAGKNGLTRSSALMGNTSLSAGFRLSYASAVVSKPSAEKRRSEFARWSTSEAKATKSVSMQVFDFAL